MGAGTGPLVRGQTYEVTLNFKPGAIDSNDKLYTNFRSALAWLIEGLKSVEAHGSFTEDDDGQGSIASITLEVSGPLDGADRENFNRAFNRLLWGFRFRKSPNPPTPSTHSVTPSDTRYRDEET
jgi:hypothetical protein